MDNGANPCLATLFLTGWCQVQKTQKRDLNAMASTQNSAPVQVLNCRRRDAFKKLPPSPFCKSFCEALCRLIGSSHGLTSLYNIKRSLRCALNTPSLTQSRLFMLWGIVVVAMQNLTFWKPCRWEEQWLMSTGPYDWEIAGTCQSQNEYRQGWDAQARRFPK